MNDLFINKEDEIIVEFCVAETKSGAVVSDVTEKEIKEVYANDIKIETIILHTATFKRPSFKDYVDLSSNTFNTADGVSIDFNPWAIRFHRIVQLIKTWSFKDKDGKEIPAAKENIEKLNPSIANTIGLQLEAHLGGI